MFEVSVRCEVPGRPGSWDEVTFRCETRPSLTSGETALRIREGAATHYYPVARLFSWAYWEEAAVTEGP